MISEQVCLDDLVQRWGYRCQMKRIKTIHHSRTETEVGPMCVSSLDYYEVEQQI